LRRLTVGGGPVESEDVGEPALHDAVPADDGRRSFGARPRELNGVIGAHPDPAVADQALQAYRRRGRADPEPFGEASRPSDLTLVLDVVDGLEVPLRGRRARRRGGASARHPDAQTAAGSSSGNSYRASRRGPASRRPKTRANSPARTGATSSGVTSSPPS